MDSRYDALCLRMRSKASENPANPQVRPLLQPDHEGAQDVPELLADAADSSLRERNAWLIAVYQCETVSDLARSSG